MTEIKYQGNNSRKLGTMAHIAGSAAIALASLFSTGCNSFRQQVHTETLVHAQSFNGEINNAYLEPLAAEYSAAATQDSSFKTSLTRVNEFIDASNEHKERVTVKLGYNPHKNEPFSVDFYLNGRVDWKINGNDLKYNVDAEPYNVSGTIVREGTNGRRIVDYSLNGRVKARLETVLADWPVHLGRLLHGHFMNDNEGLAKAYGDTLYPHSDKDLELVKNPATEEALRTIALDRTVKNHRGNLTGQFQGGDSFELETGEHILYVQSNDLSTLVGGVDHPVSLRLGKRNNRRLTVYEIVQPNTGANIPNNTINGNTMLVLTNYKGSTFMNRTSCPWSGNTTELKARVAEAFRAYRTQLGVTVEEPVVEPTSRPTDKARKPEVEVPSTDVKPKKKPGYDWGLRAFEGM